MDGHHGKNRKKTKAVKLPNSVKMLPVLMNQLQGLAT